MLVARLAATQNDRLRAGVENARKDRNQQVDSLLVDESRDEGQQRRPRAERKLQLLQQRALRECLAVEASRLEVRRDVRIGRRIPIPDVDAVDDAGELP